MPVLYLMFSPQTAEVEVGSPENPEGQGNLTMRQPKPCFKDTRQEWYANIGPIKCPVRWASSEKGERVTWKKYHTLMANRQPVNSDCEGAGVLDRYSEHCHTELAEAIRALAESCKAIQSVPLVLGTPEIRGSALTAIRRARAAALKIASAM
jgi:hypothetical protein